MPLPDIQLDDRRFEQLFLEARQRIARYTPEWTDHNESDPGITLLQLFAWLEEMLLYRLNRVPDKNYIKFLELLGIQLTPPTPAHAELTFRLTLKEGFQEIKQGTQVALSSAGDGGPVVFETDDNFYAVGLDLIHLQSYDGAQFKLLTELNRVEDKFYFPLGQFPQRGSALYLGLGGKGTSDKFPTCPIRLLFHAYTADLVEEGQAFSADAPPAAQPVIAYWEYWAGTTRKWQRLANVRDETASLTRTGFLHFDGPADFAKSKLGLLQRPDDPEAALFWVRYRIDQILGPGYELPPRLEEVLLNTIGATNAVTTKDELIGASDARPNQEFRLAHFPVLRNTLVLQVDERQSDSESEPPVPDFQVWTKVNDFAASKREDKHYTLDLATGRIHFGDGDHGKIPQSVFAARPSGNRGAKPQLEINIKAAVYRWGGGASGNAGPDTITSLQTSVPYVASVTNHRHSEGGQDEETLDEAKARAPLDIRSRSRAVTAEDFEFLATRTPGARLRRAKALPLRHPKFEPVRPALPGLLATAVPVPGVITVVVVPDLPREHPNAKPLPTEETLLQVTRYLNQHALITTEVYAAAPRYRLVQVQAEVTVAAEANSGEVSETLQKKLLDYFHPLHGGAEGNGWGFGDTIQFSEVIRQIRATPGVAGLDTERLTIFVNEQPSPKCADIALSPDELVYSIKHDLRVAHA